MQVTKKPVLCAASGEPFGPAGTPSQRGHSNVIKEIVRCGNGRETLGSESSPYRPTIHRGHTNVIKEFVPCPGGGEPLGPAISRYRPIITGNQVPAGTQNDRGHFNVIKEIARRAAGGELFYSAINVVTAFPRIVEPSPGTRCRPDYTATEAI